VCWPSRRGPALPVTICNPAAAQVYDVAGWVQKHPGGKVLLTYVGEDATDSVRAFHRDEEQMKKYLSSLRIASLAPETPLVVCPPCATRFSFTR
jgi:cytochrome b involved in lipid metabolism